MNSNINVKNNLRVLYYNFMKYIWFHISICSNILTVNSKYYALLQSQILLNYVMHITTDGEKAKYTDIPIQGFFCMSDGFEHRNEENTE
jgi:hypothetical protein